MIPVFSLVSDLSTSEGIATIETDLTNNTPEVAANVEVIGTIDVDDEDFRQYFCLEDCDNGDLYNDDEWRTGKVVQIAYNTLTSRDVTGADGSYYFQVP